VKLKVYMVIHNYMNSYEKKWNIFVAWPHLRLKRGMVKPEVMQEKVYKKRNKDIDELCARILTAWTKWIIALMIQQSDSGAHVFVHALKLKADTLNTDCVSNVFNVFLLTE